MPLRLEIVTPRGLAFEAADLERVVLRRAEKRFDLGSELVLMPRHGELMVRLPRHTLEARSHDERVSIEVDGGFAEAYNDTVTILTPHARVSERTRRTGCPPASEGAHEPSA